MNKIKSFFKWMFHHHEETIIYYNEAGEADAWDCWCGIEGTYYERSYRDY